MNKPKYIFIDESGDPGDNDGAQANSLHYAELAIELNSKAIEPFIRHIVNWRYVRGLFKEIKSLPKGNDLPRYIKPLKELCGNGLLCCSCVYLLKPDYTGPYLKIDSPRGHNPIRFRNFIHRQLLEYHFSIYPHDRGEIEVIFDRYYMSKEALRNMEDYLSNNYNLPGLNHVCHISSHCSEALQVAGQLAGSVKDIVLNEANQELVELLDFIRMKDITNIHQ